MNSKTKWLWKSDKGNIYIHCDDIIAIANNLQDIKEGE